MRKNTELCALAKSWDRNAEAVATSSANKEYLAFLRCARQMERVLDALGEAEVSPEQAGLASGDDDMQVGQEGWRLEVFLALLLVAEVTIFCLIGGVFGWLFL